MRNWLEKVSVDCAVSINCCVAVRKTSIRIVMPFDFASVYQSLQGIGLLFLSFVFVHRSWHAKAQLESLAWPAVAAIRLLMSLVVAPSPIDGELSSSR